MKYISTINTILALILCSCFTGCEEKVPEPEACFSIYTKNLDNTLNEVNTIETRETVVFKLCGDADFNAIFPGDTTFWNDQKYGGKGSVGIPISFGSDEVEYKYLYPGTFTVTHVATNSNFDDYKREIATKQITVVASGEE